MKSPQDVSIILPTYNREAFLPQAFASITSQTLGNWRLIVVDDGSTDGTRDLVEDFASQCGRPVSYRHQENRGAYSARNRGLDQADTNYVAFFDSDDVWLPQYLERCVTALEQVPELDWIYAPCRMVEIATGRLIRESTFFWEGRPKPFMRLKTRTVEGVHVIEDSGAMTCHLLHGLASGLQNSVMRRSVFDKLRFNEESRVIDDQHIVVRALAAGLRFGYLTDPLVIYNVHEDNSSGSATKLSVQKVIDISREMVLGLEQLRADLALTTGQRRALDRRLSSEYFWSLGYNGLWQAGRGREALQAFRRSLSLWPWAPTRWKTYLLAWIRVQVSDRRRTVPDKV